MFFKQQFLFTGVFFESSSSLKLSLQQVLSHVVSGKPDSSAKGVEIERRREHRHKAEW